MREEAKVINSEERRNSFEAREREKRIKREEKKEEKKEGKKRKQEDDQGGKEEKMEQGSPVEEQSSSSTSWPTRGGTKRQIEEDVEADINRLEVVSLVGEWVTEVQSLIRTDKGEHEARDDLSGEKLPQAGVRAARKEEVGYMEGRKLWTQRPVKECWDKTGKAPVSVRWVDINKGGKGKTHEEYFKLMDLRSRLVARDFKGGEMGRGPICRNSPSRGKKDATE